ncbi:MAG: 5-(carboxyamino)imidazole ribonucleotide mutase [Rickettsiales bacterium]|jgi:5-(carboxyamino)imidazole ribonucleotide mutase
MSKNKSKVAKNKVAIVMGSKSDLTTMKFACDILEEFKVEFETKIVSAHRTPQRLYKFAIDAKKNGLQVIIAGAGGAAHLPGMIAAITEIPVLGVPVESKALKGLDSLLSIAQMPYGIPVGSLAIGEPGAKNSALLAIAILALNDNILAEKLADFRKNQTDSVAINP